MRKFDSINVIPFIDIMLVLLAIVLTTATFISNGQLEITLPKAVSDSSAEAMDKTEIAIDQELQLYLDAEAVSLEQLEVKLSERTDNPGILLRIDETVPFNEFVSVIDLLKQLQLDNVSVMTQKSSATSSDEGVLTQPQSTDN